MGVLLLLSLIQVLLLSAQSECCEIANARGSRKTVSAGVAVFLQGTVIPNEVRNLWCCQAEAAWGI